MAANQYLVLKHMRYILAVRSHPQTVGKFARLDSTWKAKLGLVI